MAWIEPELLFGWAGSMMLVLWLLLITSLWVARLFRVADQIAFVGLPLLLGTAYILLMAPHVPFENGGFGSLAEVRALFADDHLLLAGWLHFLVFDYFVGGWIGRDQRAEPVPALLVVPCLLLCFLAGPVGLLLYLAIRSGARVVRARAEPAT